MLIEKERKLGSESQRVELIKLETEQSQKVQIK